MISSLFLLASFSLVAAEDGLAGWLRYAPLSKIPSQAFPSQIISLNSTESSPVYIAGLELQQGIQGILGQQVSVDHTFSTNSSSSVVVGTLAEYAKTVSTDGIPELGEDGFWLSTKGCTVQILGQNERGALYGAFEYLSLLGRGNFSEVAYATNPSAGIRWVNQWDNMDGSIERGYGGASIFFKDGHIVEDLTRVKEYARLLASIRINGLVVNNVNANASTLSTQNIEGIGRIADVLRPYGVQLGLSLNFASPTANGTAVQTIDTFDPLESSVINWWSEMTAKIYARVPDMAGYLVKANSEGQPGPLTYNRTLADGANLFAKAIKPFGGIVMFRAFVYDHHIDPINWTNDRANAAVDIFKPLDGIFDDNVVIQIKYGPIDFQVREPVSPLFANLFNTSTAIELQVTQEYLGQQNHLVYLPPLWDTILNFDLRVDGQSSFVRDIVNGEHFNRPLGGYAAVVNVGLNQTWLGSHLAMSNLYAYGRLAWEPTAKSEVILQDWIRLTFGQDRTVLDTITKMSMESWPAYENYSGNLGIQTLTDILYTHFGPNPASQDNNGWGQWTRADHDSIGMDRTVWNGTGNGTGYSGQYPSEVAAMYQNLETTPDNLLLWFHHVKYTYVLHSNKTVIQHFYDAHYDGAATAQTFPAQWATLKEKIDTQRYDEVMYRLVYQAGHSIVWRDTINGFYYNMSGIPDDHNRVGNHPWRIEAESMDLDGYIPYAVAPQSTASNKKAIVTATNSTTGTATTTVKFPDGTYDVAVGYFDLWGGKAEYKLSLGNKTVGTWKGDSEGKLGQSASIYLDGHSATRVTFAGVEIKTGDVLKVVGKADGVEPAPLDYVVFLPEGVID